MRITPLVISTILLTGLLSACKGKEQDSDSTPTSYKEVEEECSSDCDLTMPDNEDGNWEKCYFRDEFDELDYSNPFISLYISGKSSDIALNVAYSPSGIFAFRLFECRGRLVRDIYSSKITMSIRVNGQDIGPVTLPVEKNEFYIYGEDSQFLSTIFNEGSFYISLKYDGYNKDYHYVFYVNEPKGSFERAVKNLLNSEYLGE